MAVTRKEPKRKHTQRQSFAIPTVNKLNFRKLSISKKKMRERYKIEAKNSELKNILNEQFNPEHPDAVWCSDITYIWTYEGFV